jgi:hypothetical protein
MPNFSSDEPRCPRSEFSSRSANVPSLVETQPFFEFPVSPLLFEKLSSSKYIGSLGEVKSSMCWINAFAMVTVRAANLEAD